MVNGIRTLFPTTPKVGASTLSTEISGSRVELPTGTATTGTPFKRSCAAAAAGGGTGKGSMRPLAPAPDSAPIGGKGPGDVVKKPIGNQSGWGDLPPHQRQEALQQIGKDFPAHYRDVIEQYFRKLASESSENNEK